MDAEHVQVLKWVADGCPPDRYTDGHTHKLRARALAGRGLVTVRRSKGVWTAGITDAGRSFLATGNLPTSGPTRSRRKTQAAAAPTPATRPPGKRPVARTAPSRGEPKAAGGRTSPTAELVADVVAAGGDLTITGASRWHGHNLTSMVTASRRHATTPPGARLYLYTDVDGIHIRLLHVPGWIPQHDQPLAVPATTGRLHPVLRRFHTTPHTRRDLTRNVAVRAVRLLQALADEAARRGHHVSGPHHGPVDGRTPRVPALTLTVHSQQVHVRITQVHLRRPHQPTKAERDRQARYEWATPPKWDTVVTDRLRLHISSTHPYPDTHFTDGAAALEQHLHLAMFGH